MVLNVEIYRFVARVFAPNRKKNSCQEMGMGYLRGWSRGIWLMADGSWLMAHSSWRKAQGVRHKDDG
jgi:hypothetical protein